MGVSPRRAFEILVGQRESKLLCRGVCLPGSDQRLGQLNPGVRKRWLLLHQFVEDLDRLAIFSLTVVYDAQVQPWEIEPRIETDGLRESRNRFVQAVELQVKRAEVVERAQVL